MLESDLLENLEDKVDSEMGYVKGVTSDVF